jgi:hypothetical protein
LGRSAIGGHGSMIKTRWREEIEKPIAAVTVRYELGRAHVVEALIAHLRSLAG